MDTSSWDDLARILFHLKMAPPSQIKKIQSEYNSLSFQDEISFGDYLVKKKYLQKGQLARMKALLYRGYYFCQKCHQIYPNSLGEGVESRGCSSCGQNLSYYQMERTHTQVTLGTEEEYFSTGPPEFLEGSDVPRYPIIKTLGEGGYGRVYQVRDPLSGRKMALKILKKRGASKAQIKKRFLREIRITSHLEHPNIMPVYECGYLRNGSLFLAMKELRGGTLRKLLKKRKKEGPSSRDLRDFLEIFLKVCDAISYSHSRGIIHRDLKPANIAVGDFGEVMVMDWGIAKAAGVPEVAPETFVPDEESGKRELIEVNGQTLTLQGMLGTPGYMAPEQARAEDVTLQTDIHALGAILYEILTGNPPYKGSAQARLVQLLSHPAANPLEEYPHRFIPPELAAISMKCLEKKPRHRYETVGELAKDIQRYLAGFSVSVRRDSLFEKTSKWIGRNKALSAGLALAVLAVLVSVFTMNFLDIHQREKAAREHLTKAKALLIRPEVVSTEKLKEKYHREYVLNRQESVEAKRERQKVLKILLEARKELEQAWKLDTQNEEIRRRLFDLEKEIGELALLGGNYLLAETSFEKCYSLDSHRGASLLERVKSEKERVQKIHLQKVEKIMATLAKTPPSAGMVDEYVTEIVKRGKPEVVQLLLHHVNSDYLWPRRVAIKALGKIGDRHTMYKGKDSVQWLIERLEVIDSSEKPREAEIIIWALGRLGDARANEVVEKVRLGAGSDSKLWFNTKTPYSWIPEEKKEKKTYQDWCQAGKRYFNKKMYQKARIVLQKAMKLNPDGARGHFLFGGTLLKLREYKGARKHLDRAIELDPENSQYYYTRARVFLAIEEFEQALKDCQKAVSLNPKVPSYFICMGDVFFEIKKYSPALEKYKKALELDPELPMAYVNLANIYFFQEKKTLALKTLKKAIEVNPNFSQVYNLRARIYQEMGKIRLALDDFNKSIEINPQNSKIYNNRGILYGMLGEAEKAMKNFDQALKLDPDFASVYTNRGHLYYKKKEYQKALQDYNRALDLNPRIGVAYLNRGLLYTAMKKFPQAIEDFNKALSLNSQFRMTQMKEAERTQAKRSNAYQLRGDVYTQMKKYSLAIKDYNRAIELDPKNFKALHNRAKIFLDKGRFSKALDDYNRALEVNPLFERAYLNRGFLFLKMKNFGRAQKDLKKAIEINPNNPRGYFNLGLLDYRNRNFERSLKYMSRAIELNFQNPDAYGIRGAILIFQKKYKEALKDFSYLIDHYPRLAQAYLKRAECYIGLGRKKMALKDYQEFLKINPHSPLSQKVKRRIDWLKKEK